jgi:hypothetical protein
MTPSSCTVGIAPQAWSRIGALGTERFRQLQRCVRVLIESTHAELSASAETTCALTLRVDDLRVLCAFDTEARSVTVLDVQRDEAADHELLLTSRRA